MRNMFRQSTGRGVLTKGKGVVIASFVAGAMALPFVIPAQRAHAQYPHHELSRGLLGAWIGNATIDPKTVPPGATLTFMLLDMFAAGGGYVESNTGPAAGQPDGKGNWVQTGYNRFEASQVRFDFDAGRNLTGINHIRSSFTLSDRGDELTAITTVDILRPDGTMLPFHPVAAYRGTRVAIPSAK